MFRKRMVQALVFCLALAVLVVFLAELRIIKLPDAIDPFGQPHLNAAYVWPNTARMSQLETDRRMCATALREVGMNSTFEPFESEGPACYKRDTVLVSRLSLAHLKPEATRCGIAARLYMWERAAVQPAAQRYFGESVSEITHFGSYNCRKIRNSVHMSEHATANAFDISGVILKDGTAITVKRGWTAGGREAAFLHAIHNALCSYFNLTLSPDYNADHADHFHVDMGRVHNCR